MRAPLPPILDAEDPMLDLEALEAPPRLSLADGLAAAGPDWSWTQPDRYDEGFDD